MASQAMQSEASSTRRDFLLQHAQQPVMTVDQLFAAITNRYCQTNDRDEATGDIQKLYRFIKNFAHLTAISLLDEPPALPNPPKPSATSRNKRPIALVEADETPSTPSQLQRNAIPETASPLDQLDSLLLPIRLSITARTDVKRLIYLRSEFCHQIRALKGKPILKNSHAEKLGLNDKKIAKITNYFFHEILGPKSKQHLRNLVDSYNISDSDNFNQGISQRAKRMAELETTPETLRVLYNKFSRSTQAVAEEARLFLHIVNMNADLSFLECFDALRERARAGDRTLIMDLGLKDSLRQGVGLASLLAQRFREDMGMKKNDLSNCAQRIQGVKQLVNVFGLGFLALLPFSQSRKVHVFGNQTMVLINPILKQLLPDLVDICKVLETHVVVPIRDGIPIRLSPIETGTEVSLQQAIEDALPRASQILTIHHRKGKAVAARV